MSNPYIGQLKAFPYNFAPKSWAFCNGQTMPIAQNTALFSLLGTTYGGDGKTTFGIPDLRGRTPIGFGQGPGLDNFALGQTGGAPGIFLGSMGGAVPQHTHIMQVSTGTKLSTDPDYAYLGGASIYATVSGNPDCQLDMASLMSSNDTQMRNSGGMPGGMPGTLELMQPYLALNWFIAIDGIFPPRS